MSYNPDQQAIDTYRKYRQKMRDRLSRLQAAPVPIGAFTTSELAQLAIRGIQVKFMTEEQEQSFLHDQKIAHLESIRNIINSTANPLYNLVDHIVNNAFCEEANNSIPDILEELGYQVDLPQLISGFLEEQPDRLVQLFPDGVVDFEMVKTAIQEGKLFVSDLQSLNLTAAEKRILARHLNETGNSLWYVLTFEEEQS